MTKESNKKYVIQVGRGVDGGFGDYSNPYWLKEPLSYDGKVLYFVDEELAKKFAKELSSESSDTMYAKNNNDYSYSGIFPLEYQVLEVPNTDELVEKSSVEKFKTLISDRDREVWASEQATCVDNLKYDISYDNEDYEDYEEE